MTRSWLRRAGEAAALALTHPVPTGPPADVTQRCGISLLQRLHKQQPHLSPARITKPVSSVSSVRPSLIRHVFIPSPPSGFHRFVPIRWGEWDYLE